MFDAIGGMAVFDVNPEGSTFSGAYYPSRSYKIWNFYDRDFSQSSIAWNTAFTKVNVSAHKLWEKIQPEVDAPPPNVDFWKVGNNIIAGTEYYSVGFTFDLDTFDHFRFFPFIEEKPTMRGQPMVPIHMPIHERMDLETGLLWATVTALDVSKKPPSLHQVIFTVDTDGVRRVEGVHDYSPWDPRLCQNAEGVYPYDPQRDFFPRNMHSITSTKNYVILPLTSVVFNPCIVLKGPRSPEVTFSQLYKFNKDTQVTFLVFDKRSKKFVSTLKFDAKLPQFISHQFNAYEVSDKVLVADMIGYGEDAYELLSIKTLMDESHSGLTSAHAYRYTLDLEGGTVTGASIVPKDPANLEFPQFNHNFEGLPYKYGYAIDSVFYAGNSIHKIDLTDFTGSKNKVFTPKHSTDTIALMEPYFAQRPGATDEDDGVLVSRGYDITVNKTRVFVIDAKTMEQVGEILAPSDTPFGFHERFYLKDAFKGKKNEKKSGKSEL